MKKLTGTLLIITIIVLAACSKNSSETAYGTITATEYHPASEVSGKIISFQKGEGDMVQENEVIAIIDTTDIQLQINEMEATIELKKLMTRNRDNELAILAQEQENLAVDIDRFTQLTAADAAPEKNLDDLNASAKVLKLKVQSAHLARLSSEKETELAQIKLAQLDAKKTKFFLKSPIKGTLLNTYFSVGEIVPAGKPYAKIADLEIMSAKVYISETQLPELTLAKYVMLGIDTQDGGYSFFLSHITNIAHQAEFTPKIIQTREQRVKLVYEVELECYNNEGELKIGMPVTMFLDMTNE
ncbi:MAG: HlyD family efflux transporter periplasmic adaptor subunit [Candidatus Stygibacter frigidus]|nr:HlyD family efflux transporter periplasmic adaptor subunit [Candidatus Stygibacter frigidus]